VIALKTPVSGCQKGLDCRIEFDSTSDGKPRQQKHYMNKFTKFSLLGLLAMAVAGTPVALHAQNTPTAEKKISKRPLPFHGKLKAIDNTAKTISVGNETIQITSETKISKYGKPATLADGVVGEEVGGSYRKDAEGKLNAIALRFGPRSAPGSNTKTNTP